MGYHGEAAAATSARQPPDALANRNGGAPFLGVLARY
jgi:hypothetical protein